MELAQLNEQLEGLVGGLSLAGWSSDEVRSLAVEANRTHRLAEGLLTRLAAEASQHETSGSGPVAEEVVQSGGAISSRRAKQLTARAALRGVLPALGAAVDAGEARPENADRVAAVTARGLSAGERERLGSADREITERATNLPPETFAKFLAKKLAAIADPPTDAPSEAERQRADSWFDLRRRHGGMWDLNGELDDERGRIVNDLITRHARHLATDGEGGPTANDRAAALVELVTRRPDGNGSGSARMGIGYIIDAQTLAQGPHEATVAQTWGGEDYDPARIARLACDADHYAIAIDAAGLPAGAGRTRRHASREQRLQLRALYTHCPLDGATPFDRCEIHHVNVFHEHGGTTTLDNLIPISSTWHHRIHDRGWTLTMDPDRTLTLARPDGTPDRTIPPPTPLTRRTNRPRAPT